MTKLTILQLTMGYRCVVADELCALNLMTHWRSKKELLWEQGDRVWPLVEDCNLYLMGLIQHALVDYASITLSKVGQVCLETFITIPACQC